MRDREAFYNFFKFDFLTSNIPFMAKIVDLHSYRTQAVERRCFGPWRKRFAESYAAESKLRDLSDKTLFYLAQPGENSTAASYELIMGVLDLGNPVKFHYLNNQDQMKVVDIHLFFADQVRFEMMRRLGWLEDFPSAAFNLLEVVRKYDEIKTACRDNPPQLAELHPEFHSYRQLTAKEKEVFIRRMLPEGLEAFKKRIEE
jgi:hypothetical protein